MYKSSSALFIYCWLVCVLTANTEQNETETERPYLIFGDNESDRIMASRKENATDVEWSAIVIGEDQDNSKATALAWIECFATTAKKTSSALEKLLLLLKKGPLDVGHGVALTMIAGGLSALAQGLSFAGAIISYALSFYLPSELDVIRSEFDEISAQLDDLAARMSEATSEVKSSVEFNSWMAKYVTSEFVIRNGEAELSSVMQRIRETTDPEEKADIAGQYVAYVEARRIEDAAANIHRLAGLDDDSAVAKNLFRVYCDEKGHYPKELARLMLVLSDVLLSASRQITTYYAFKEGTNAAQEAYVRSEKLIDDVRMQYELHLWYIMRDIERHAARVVRRVVEHRAEDLEDDELAEEVQSTLASDYVWYSWAVAVIGKNGLYTSGTYESRGRDYLFLQQLGPKNDKNVLVLWQHVNPGLTSCTDAMDGSTVVFLAGTEGAIPYRIASSGDIKSTDSCWSSRERVQDYYLGKAEPYNMPQWIASASYDVNTECRNAKTACSGHGRCLVIPSSPSKICICDNGYRGENCQTQDNPEAENAIMSLLASLRLSFGDSTGLPSIVDAHQAISELDDEIEDGREKIVDILDHLKSIVSNGEILNKAQYVKTRYKQLLKGQIEEDVFGEYMDSFLKTESMDYVLVELQNTLLGVGLLDGKDGDILTTFKKSYIAHKGSSVACTETYARDVNKMIRKLAGLDQTVSEAMIWYMKWKLEESSEDDQDSIVKDAFSYVSEAQTRHEAYLRAWASESCPDLNVSGLIQKHCTEMLSFEGLDLELACDNDMVPIPRHIRCIRNGTNLVWSEEPRCEHPWSEWSQWSTCDKTCGGGRQTRTRQRTNGEKALEEKSCQEQDCCQQIYEKRKCSSGECINLDQECDGRVNCVDGSDESTCDYLRSKDTISLESGCDGYLNCHCAHHSCGWWFWKKKSCKADADNNDSRFIIHSNNDNNNGSAILHGDTVFFQFPPDPSQWLSCPEQGEPCSLTNCPELTGTLQAAVVCPAESFRIFAPARRGDCGLDLGECRGLPIRPRDRVYIQRSTTRWLSARKNEEIRTNDCPGSALDNSDVSCSCESWRIHKN